MFIHRIAATVAATLFLISTAVAGSASSIQYYGDAKRHDTKIEAAAIKKAAAKIGSLRGSLDGLDAGEHLITEQDLKRDQSSQLGFPTARERENGQTSQNSIPIV